jgi:hypothetical protein
VAEIRHACLKLSNSCRYFGVLERIAAISLFMASIFGPDLVFTAAFVTSITDCAAAKSSPIIPLAAFRNRTSAGILLPKYSEKNKPGTWNQYRRHSCKCAVHAGYAT